MCVSADVLSQCGGEVSCTVSTYQVSDGFSLLVCDGLTSEVYFRESPNLSFTVSLRIGTWKFKADNMSFGNQLF